MSILKAGCVHRSVRERSPRRREDVHRRAAVNAEMMPHPRARKPIKHDILPRKSIMPEPGEDFLF
jgi:hypothetical protein